MNSIQNSSPVIELSETQNYIELTNRLCYYDYPNGNGLILSSIDADEKAKTLINQPVVAKYVERNNLPNFGGHEIKKDKKGHVTFGTDYIGVHTEVYTQDEEVELFSGEIVKAKCLYAKSRIWKRKLNIINAIRRLYALGKLFTSWELASLDKTDNNDGTETVNDYYFETNCILGTQNFPSFGKCATTLEVASQEENPEMLMAEALANDIYNTEKKEENMAKTQKIAEEKVIEKPTEISEEEVKKTDSIAEVSEDENSECKDKKEKSEEEPKDENKEENKETSETVESSSLTVRDLRIKISDECRKIHRWFYICFMYPTENYVLGKTDEGEENELDFVKFTYTVGKDDTVTIGEPEKVTLSVSVAEINTKIAEKDEAIVKANEEIQTLKAENETLASYKERCEKEDIKKAESEIAEKQKSLKQYALNSKQISEKELETNEFKKIISELDEVKIKSIISDRFVASLAKDNEIETKVEVSEVKEEKPKANLEIAEDNDIDAISIVKTFLRK